MIQQTPGQLYRATQRGHIENAQQRLYATLNFEGYNAPARGAFGLLKVCNDETLAPLQELKRYGKGETLLLLPLVGTVQYEHNGRVLYADPNEAAWISLQGEVVIKNPYETELINFLYLVFDGHHANGADTVTIDLHTRNVLVPFSLPGEVRAKMALFDGRGETLYEVKQQDNGLFLFVISGAFEVQGRLLEERDALALWDTNDADMEALSDNALILLFEIPLQGFTAQS